LGIPLLCLTIGVCIVGSWPLLFPDLLDFDEPLAAFDIAEPEGAPAASESIRQLISAAGTDFDCPGGAHLSVPAGAVSAETAITVTQLAAAPPFPVEYLSSPAGPAYEVTVPEDCSLQQSVELALPFEVQEGTDPSLYTVFAWDGALWRDVGGIADGNVIRTQLDHFSVFQPALGYQERRPVGFVNNGPHNATVRPWTFVPATTDTPAPPPTASTTSFAPTSPGLSPNSSRFLSLPLGRYTWCMDWTDGRDADGDQYFDYYHWIDQREVTLDANDSTALELAEQVIFNTESAAPGPCGVAPVISAGASAAGTGAQGGAAAGAQRGEVDWSTLPLRPVGFVNSGPHNATVRPWTYVPTGASSPVPAPNASTASFAPTAPGLSPNSSRFLTLPIGRYTWCMDWTNGRDEDGDHYFDYYHWVDPREVTLAAEDSTDLDFAKQVNFSTDSGTPGRCGSGPYGTAGSATGEGGVLIIPGAGLVTIRLTWVTTDDLDLHVIEPNGEHIWYHNRTSSTGGTLTNDANAGCQNTTFAPVENIVWSSGSAPLGTYEVRVVYFADCDNVQPVAFRLVIFVGGQVVYSANNGLEGQGDYFTYSFTR